MSSYYGNSTLQGTCAAVEYVLEGQIHLPLLRKFLHLLQYCSAMCMLEKDEKNKPSHKVVVVIKNVLEIHQ